MTVRRICMLSRSAFAFIAVLLLAVSPVTAAGQNPASPCPQGMAPIGGGFCIDAYEYPNMKGVKPLSSVSWDQAAKLCEAGGKRLCSFAEWRAACGGPKDQKYPYG